MRSSTKPVNRMWLSQSQILCETPQLVLQWAITYYRQSDVGSPVKEDPCHLKKYIHPLGRNQATDSDDFDSISLLVGDGCEIISGESAEDNLYSLPPQAPPQLVRESSTMDENTCRNERTEIEQGDQGPTR